MDRIMRRLTDVETNLEKWVSGACVYVCARAWVRVGWGRARVWVCVWVRVRAPN